MLSFPQESSDIDSSTSSSPADLQRICKFQSELNSDDPIGTVDGGCKFVEARLDILTPIDRMQYYVDTTVVDVISIDPALVQQRANR